MIISHISRSNVFKGLIIVSVLLAVGGFFVAYAEESAVIGSADPAVVSGGFTPNIADLTTLPRGSEAYLGRTTTYVGPDTFPTDEDSIQWRVTIDGPSALTADMVDLDEVGFNDPDGDGTVLETYHYPFSAVDGNLVANGSCVDANDHVCNNGTDAFSLDEDDIFTNADKLKFNSNAPLGSYTITYELVNTNGDIVLSNAYEISVDLVVKIFIDADEDGVFDDGIETDYPSIQEAIDAASPGDTIQVAAGTYEGNIDIENSGITLQGSGFDETTIIEVDGVDGYGFRVLTSDVTIDGFRFEGEGEGTGVLIDDGNVELDNIVISNNGFFDLDFGVFFESCCSDAGHITVTADEPGGTVFDGISDTAVWLQNGGNGVFTVENTFISNVDNDGIFIAGANEANILNNTLSGIGGDGILVNDVSDGATLNITDNLAISGNVGNGIAIDEIYNSAVLIDGNTINGNGEAGIFVNQISDSTVTINQNSITGNDTGLFVDVSDSEIDATNNWWGAASGPFHETENPDGTGNSVSDNVEFDPWFINPGLTVLSSAISEGSVSVDTGNLDFETETAGVAVLPPSVNVISLSNDSAMNVSANTAATPPASHTIGDLVITVEKSVQLESGIADEPIVIRNQTLAHDVFILDGTTISAPAEWNGIIQPPKTAVATGTPPSASFSVGGTVIEVGSPNAVLIFDMPATLLLKGVTGPVGYKPAISGTWVQITTTCSGTFAEPTAPPFPGECVISDGVDTKIVTFHFTTFGSLIRVPPPAPPETGVGGGGGGTTTPTPTPTPTVMTPTQSVAVTTPPAGQVLGVATFSFTKTLKIGSAGNDVTELQNRLTAEGVYSGPVTGYFGPLTEGGVKAFQEKYGIEQVGIVGPLTRAKLNESQVLGAATTVDKAQLQAQLASLQEQLKELLHKLVEALRSEVNRQLKLNQ